MKDKLLLLQEILDIEDIQLELKQGAKFFEATLEYFPKSNNCVILYKDEISEAYLVHELGHLALMKQLDFLDLAIPMIDDPQVNLNLQPILNAIVDLFVNYNLREIPETYTPLKQQLYEYLDNWNDTKEGIEEETDVFILLSWYILWYVLFQYFLQPNDFHQIEEKYQELIKLTEFRLRTLSKKLMPKQLLKVKKIMDSFPSYINPFSKKKIINYCRAIVQKLKLWTPNEIIYAMGWFFPSMKT